jgi:cytochrome c peroxidase
VLGQRLHPVALTSALVAALFTSACDGATSTAAASSSSTPAASSLVGSDSAAAIASIAARAAEVRVGVVPTAPVPEETPLEAVGRQIFFDPRLSDPPGTSCASCHDPARAFAGNHGSTNGVPAGSRPGHFARRNTPSVLYMKFVPAFHFALEDDDDPAPSPFGGLGWGGRASSVSEFVSFPLFDPDEMNGGSATELAGKVRAAPYAEALAHEVPGALTTTASAMGALGKALETFLTSARMAPFTSRYDDYLRHSGTLTPLELQGLKTFKDPDRGACDACHRFEDSSNRPSRSLFTDFGYDGVAVPRNAAIPANAVASYHDLGLCERKDTKAPSSDAKWCVKFRAPSLRNVAVRERFMHNGEFTKLRDVVAFYATRATSPSRWYPPGAKFDDVPAKYLENVNVTSLPYNRREGAPPPLDDEDIDAIVAFLGTLTDAEYLPH